MVYCFILNNIATGAGTIIPPYPLSPSMLLNPLLLRKITFKLVFSKIKIVISNLVLCKGSLKSAYKYCFYDEMTWVGIIVPVPVTIVIVIIEDSCINKS